MRMGNETFKRKPISITRQPERTIAAMRDLPIALVNVDNESRLIKDSFLNAIITHGHPRAILGAILFALAVKHALTASRDIPIASFVEYLCEGMNNTGKAITEDDRITL